jgi:DNA primase
MLNPYQKKKLVIKKPFYIPEKPNMKPDIISVFEYFNPNGRKYRYYNKKMTVHCLFHDDRCPSLCLYEETNTYYCFACGANGDSYNMIMKLENIDFKQALEFAKNHNFYCDLL